MDHINSCLNEVKKCPLCPKSKQARKVQRAKFFVKTIHFTLS